jgi:hypothetical protein
MYGSDLFFPEMKLRGLPKQNYNYNAVSQFPHSCICERVIYSQDRSAYFAAAKSADRSWEYINDSQKHECRNFERGHAVSFLGVFVSNFRYSAVKQE